MNPKSLLKKKDYETFLQLAQKGKISAQQQLQFYKEAPDLWIQTLINYCPPSQEAEKIVIQRQLSEGIHLISVLYGFDSATLAWVMKDGDDKMVKNVVDCLYNKPSVKIEQLMVRRQDKELLKLWISKFYTLEESTERILHEELELSSMLSYYIDLQNGKVLRQGVVETLDL